MTKTNTVRVKVEQRHIDDALKRIKDFRSHKTCSYARAYECPLALALQETLYLQDVHVKPNGVYINSAVVKGFTGKRTLRVYRLSKRAFKFIQTFDMRPTSSALHPSTFVLELV